MPAGGYFGRVLVVDVTSDVVIVNVGLKSEAVREILPRATEEAVHRDYLVLE